MRRWSDPSGGSIFGAHCGAGPAVSHPIACELATMSQSFFSAVELKNTIIKRNNTFVGFAPNYRFSSISRCMAVVPPQGLDPQGCRALSTVHVVVSLVMHSHSQMGAFSKDCMLQLL